MEKQENEQQTVTRQYAMIWNYNAHIEHQYNYYNGSENINSHCNEKEKTASISKEQLGRAIKAVEKHFWGQSAYAIIFCAARDMFDYTDNATFFENDISSVASRLGLHYPCPPNTISSAIYNNPYLKLHVSKWEKQGVKPRSILLANAFVKAVEDLQNE